MAIRDRQTEEINETEEGKLRLSRNRKLVCTTKVKPPDRFCQWKMCESIVELKVLGGEEDKSNTPNRYN